MEDLAGHVLTLKHRYEVLRELPQHGLGQRWRARLRPFELEVQVEVLEMFVRHQVPAPITEAIVRRLSRQAWRASQLRSPGVLRVLDYGELSPQVPFVVSDDPRGACLEDIIARQGRLPLRGTLKVIEELAHMLDEAHALGLGHLGLNARCVYFEELPSGTVTRLGGFGAGLLHHELTLLGSSSSLEQLAVEHLAPETFDQEATRQWRARFCGADQPQEEGWEVELHLEEPLPSSPSPEDPVGADVFSLASLAYRCLVGEAPFWLERPETLQGRLDAVRRGELVHPREHGVQLPEGVWRVLRGGLALDPGARPPSASEFARDLARAARLAPVLAQHDTPAPMEALEEDKPWFFEDEAPLGAEAGEHHGWMGELSPAARYLVAALLLLVATNVITLLLLALGQEASAPASPEPAASASARR